MSCDREMKIGHDGLGYELEELKQQHFQFLKERKLTVYTRPRNILRVYEYNGMQPFIKPSNEDILPFNCIFKISGEFDSKEITILLEDYYLCHDSFNVVISFDNRIHYHFQKSNNIIDKISTLYNVNSARITEESIKDQSNSIQGKGYIISGKNLTKRIFSIDQNIKLPKKKRDKYSVIFIESTKEQQEIIESRKSQKTGKRPSQTLPPPSPPFNTKLKKEIHLDRLNVYGSTFSLSSSSLSLYSPSPSPSSFSLFMNDLSDLKDHFPMINIPFYPDFINCQFIGQFKEGFILVKDPKGIIMVIDQHAASERIRLEELEMSNQFANVELPSSLPLSNVIQSLSKKEISILECIGFSFDRENEKIKIPLPVSQVPINDLLNKLLCNGTEKTKENYHELLKTIACHGAIKFGDCLSRDEAISLVHGLNDCILPDECAHGRPTFIPLFYIGLNK